MVAKANTRTPALSDTAGDAAEALRGGIAALREQASTQAAVVTTTLRERTTQMLSDQKLRAAEELSHLGAAVRRAADKLHDTHSVALAQYVDTAAQKLDGAAQFLEERELTDLAGEVGQFARRNPAWVVGGLFLAGLAIGRFVKAGETGQASSRRRQPGGARGERGSRQSSQSSPSSTRRS